MSNSALFRRLEAQQPFGNLDRGFRAELADPLWLLGRQWQLGEHAAKTRRRPRSSRSPRSTSSSIRCRNIPISIRRACHPKASSSASNRIGGRSGADSVWARRTRCGNLGPADAGAGRVQLRDVPAPYDALEGSRLRRPRALAAESRVMRSLRKCRPEPPELLGSRRVGVPRDVHCE